MRRTTRGERAIAWIEAYCRVPSGPQRGEPVKLSETQRQIVRKLYDTTENVEPLSGHLGCYIALLHTCGPEAVAQSNALPLIETDVFSVWASTSERLRDVLKRDGEVIRCPELGTSFPRAA